MRKILVHIPVEKYGEYDIFTKHSDAEFVTKVKKNGGICPNVGNRLWFQGIISAIQCDDNIIDYWSPSMSKEKINEQYDLIVAPMANVFSVNYISLLETLAERFRGLKIPVYVVACGVQASNYDEIETICKSLKDPASRFISSVYDTGGEFALRGNFTKEFFDRLGFNSAVVTGCPSLYQLGRNLKVEREKVDKDNFFPIFNGVPANYKKYMNEYTSAIFFDQDAFWQEVLDPSFLSADNVNGQIEKLIRKWGFDTTKYLLEERIKLFPSMNSWREFIIDNDFSCSFGSRIHGNIMPILAGIPAILECRDARTREIAEFFDIPFVLPNDKFDSLYELYMDIDYSNFNKNFNQRYDHYEKFLRKYGIIDKINTDNRFFYRCNNQIDMSTKSQQNEKLLRSLMSKRVFWNGYSNILNAKRGFLSKIKD